MKYTGERMVPEVMNPQNGMLKEHIARYHFASAYASGRVLDLGCGVGYGTEILLDEDGDNRIERVVGLDCDPETIAYARDMYGYQKAEFFVEDIRNPKLPEKIGTFDTILCYEVIEHLYEDEAVIKNIAAMLSKNGALLISTPFGKGKGKPCASPFHVHQYNEAEFLALLAARFRVSMYHQRDITIEKPLPATKYYLMLAVCSHP